MTRKRRPIPPPPARAIDGWTIQRAMVVGIVSGLTALVLAAALGSGPAALVYLYVLLLVLTILCGASILWITLQDIRTRGRGGRMRPIRVFDIAAGLALTLPAFYGLWLIWPDLGL